MEKASAKQSTIKNSKRPSKSWTQSLDAPDRLPRSQINTELMGSSNVPISSKTISTVSDSVQPARGINLLKIFSKFTKRDIQETRFTGNDANHLFSVSLD